MRGNRHEALRDRRARGKAAYTAAVRAQGTLPNVFVVGAGKSGTTALYHYFKVHPQIFVPESVKETNYMAFCDGLPPMGGPGDQSSAHSSITKLADYHALYRRQNLERVAADVSPNYLYYAKAAPKIAELCPNAKIVMILRNPVECAFSLYSMVRRERREPCPTFREAFELSAERVAAGWQYAWDYQNYFMFSKQVARYLNLFPRSQLFIRRYELLKQQPERFYGELCEFLGIDHIDVHAANRQVNVGATRRDMIRTRLLGRVMLRTVRVAGLFFLPAWKAALRRRLLAPAYVLSDEDRRMLTDHFSDDIQALARMLSWDLSDWLKV